MHPGQQQQMMMYRQLHLSEEQKQKFKTLNEDFRKNMMDLRKQDDITVKEWRNRMETLQKKHREDLQGMFTQEQKAQMEKMKRERKQMAEIDAKARTEKMKIQLGLSNEQSEKLNNQRKEMMEKMKALRENQTMDMEKKREEIKALMEKRKETMRSILTHEQRKKMQQMKMHLPRKPGELS